MANFIQVTVPKADVAYWKMAKCITDGGHTAGRPALQTVLVEKTEGDDSGKYVRIVATDGYRVLMATVVAVSGVEVGQTYKVQSIKANGELVLEAVDTQFPNYRRVIDGYDIVTGKCSFQQIGTYDLYSDGGLRLDGKVWLNPKYLPTVVVDYDVHANVTPSEYRRYVFVSGRIGYYLMGIGTKR